MDICILGGTGFVGSRLAPLLFNAGHRMRIPTRNLTHGGHLKVLPTVRLIEADVHDEAALRQLVGGCDAVINLVGILNEKGRSGAGFHRAHTELTRKVIAACERGGVGRLVQMSALGASADSGPSHYLRTKGQAEIAVTGSKLDWVILQPSVIFGPGDSFLNRFAGLLRAIPFAFPLAMPDTRFAPVHVDDVGAAITAAVKDESLSRQVIQLCGTEVYSLRELVQKIAWTIDVRRRIWGLPNSLSKLQAIIMELAPGKPFSLDNYRSLQRHCVCSENGLARLGIKPKSLDKSISACLASFNPRSPLDNYRELAGR